MQDLEKFTRAPLTSSQLVRIIQNNDNSQYITNEAYYQGKNPTIIQKDYDGVPDNRIPLPFARRTINDIVGYAYKPGNVRYTFDNAENSDESIELIKQILDYNDEEIISGEIFQDALIKGEGCELQFVYDGMPQFVQIPREQCIFIWKDQIKDELDYSIRYYETKTVDTDGSTIIIKHADVYYSDRIDYYEWKQIAANQDIDPQIKAQRTDEDTHTLSYRFIRSEEHYYEHVPLYPYRINSDLIGVFQPSNSIIDTLDNFGSDSIANAIDRFNETLMLLSKKIDSDTAENIKEYKIIDDLGPKMEGHFVEFLNRQMDITSTVEGFKIFERLYYELTGVPNLNDEKFNAKSGIAILYALVPFENAVSTYQMYFTRGLQHRIDLLNVICNKLFNMAPIITNLKWERNLPLDLQSLVNEIVTLKSAGILSDETLLKMLPDSIVEDVEYELEKVAEQKEKNMEMFNLRFQEPQEEDDTE